MLKFEGLTVVTPDDLGWVRDNLPGLLALEDEFAIPNRPGGTLHVPPRGNYRMMAASCGLALKRFLTLLRNQFSPSIVGCVASGKTRAVCRDRRTAIHELYKQRSKAVHGGKISEDELKEHVSSTRQLLAQLLSRIVTRGSLPSAEEFTDLTVMP